MMSEFTGKHFLSDTVYRAANGLANSDALMIENNPSTLSFLNLKAGQQKVLS